MRIARNTSLLILAGVLAALGAFPAFAQEKDGLLQIDIDIVPLRKFDRVFKDRLAKKEIDLNAPFAVGLKGVLKEDGHLDPATVKYTIAGGDPRSIKIVQEAVEAVNDSGYLRYLALFSGKVLELSIVQDEANFRLALKAEIETSRRAATLRTVFNMFISQQILKIESGSKADRDILDILKNVSVNTAEKELEISFAMAKPAFQAMLQKRLANSPGTGAER